MDASPVVAPPSVGRPLRLLPFRGWRLAAGRIGDPATARLFARHYRDVPERLDRWRREGQLLEDPEPAVYVHEYTSQGLTVRGLVGALDLSLPAAAPDDRAVLPHEGVHPDQVAALAERMTSWQLNPAPILLVHRGSEALRALVAETVPGAPFHEDVDRLGQRHRLWAISDTDRLHALDDAVASSTALIADGHHRYAAYLSMQGTQRLDATSAGLAMLVDQGDTPLFLGAIHRVLLGVTLTQVREEWADTTTVQLVPRADAFDALGHTTMVLTDGHGWATVRLELPDDGTAVELLHDTLLPPLRLSPRRLTYQHSVEHALSRVRSTRGVAVLLPALDVDLVLRVARSGRLLPEKATSFQPKPSTGVLIRSLRAG